MKPKRVVKGVGEGEVGNKKGRTVGAQASSFKKEGEADKLNNVTTRYST